jgi:DNA-binding IscR family transcriptional regulator
VQLLAYSDYALRVLMYLGLHDGEDRLASIEEIARAYAISPGLVERMGGALEVEREAGSG